MTGAQPRGRRWPRDRRITRGSEIRALFRRGTRSRMPHLDVFDSEAPASRSRVGLVVPRYGHTAVRRNQVKRRLREAIRTELLPRLDSEGRSRDILVRARREAYDLSYARLSRELESWVRRRWRDSS